MRWLDVCGHEPPFGSNCQPLTLNLPKKLLILYLSFKRWSWSSCLSCTSFFKLMFALFMFLCSLSSCVWVSFAHLLNCVLVVHILVAFPRSCSWCYPSLCSYNSSISCCFSKLMFLSFLSLCSYCSSRSCSCYFSKSHSCYFSWSCFCCSKLVTKVITTPSSHSCSSY
jgi:hypothetical protein